MSNDSFESSANSVAAPARGAFEIDAGEDVTLLSVTKAIYVGTGGDLMVRLVDAASDVCFRNLASGAILDVRAVAVRADGTTAADLVGLV